MQVHTEQLYNDRLVLCVHETEGNLKPLKKLNKFQIYIKKPWILQHDFVRQLKMCFSLFLFHGLFP